MRPIPLFSKYYVTKFGQIYNKNGLLMKTFRCHSGYDRIDLKRDDGEYHKIYVHRAVGMAFIENPNNYPIIDHIDRHKTNNTVENLRWVTAQMNALNRTFNTIMPRYIKIKRFKVKKTNDLYWVIDARNSVLNYRKRFKFTDFTYEEILEHRNQLMLENNIPITD